MNNFQTELQIIVENIISGGIILFIKLILIVLIGFWPILFLVGFIKDWKKRIKEDAYRDGYNKGVGKITDTETKQNLSKEKINK
jgi:hypothetical protein